MRVRPAFALLVLATVAFTVYGSLVPFEYRPRSWDEATDSFVRLMRERLMFASRSDALANVLLGMPLGFGLLGLIFAERRAEPLREGLFGLLLLPGCGLFAASIEFAQLYFPLRTCAGSDVICQMIGAVFGMAIWLVCGRRLAGFGRDFWNGTGSAQRALFAYLALLAFIQVLPLDLNASPRTAAKKALRDVSYIPFGDGFDAAKAAKVFALFLPLGLFASSCRSQRRAGQLVVLAFATAAALESLQLPIESRMPSATDVVVGAIGIIAGFAFGTMQRPEFPTDTARGYFLGWLIVLAAIWGPLPFPLTSRTPPVAFDWMPGLPLESGNPLFALEDMLTKLEIFALGGAIVGALDVELKARTRCVIATGIGLAVAGGQESLQTVFGAHTPSITDVLLGGLGAGIGALIAAQQRPPVATAGLRPLLGEPCG